MKHSFYFWVCFAFLGSMNPVLAQWTYVEVSSTVDAEYQFAGWTSTGQASFAHVEDDYLYFSTMDSAELALERSLYIGISNPRLWVANLLGEQPAELVISGEVDGKGITWIFEANAESNTFSRSEVSDIRGDVVLEDVDTDGLVDLIISTAEQSFWYLNSTTGFVFCSSCSTDPVAGVLDVNNDGLKELITKSEGQYQLRYSTSSRVNSTGTMGNVQWGDFTGSGFADVVFLEDGELAMQSNTDGLNFEEVVIAENIDAFKLIDFNADSTLDIVASAGSQLMLFEFGQADATIIYDELQDSYFAFGDFDYDHDADLLVNGVGSPVWIRQEANTTPPMNPDSISYQTIVTEEETILQWAGVSGAYTYNVRAWDAFGNQLIPRIIPTFNGHGNAGYANRYVYKGDQRILGWSVRSVNHSFIEGIDGYECELGPEDVSMLPKCEGDSVHLGEIAEAQWYKFTGDSSIATNANFIAQESGTYHATYVDSVGTVRNLSVNLQVSTRPDIDLATMEFCEGEDVEARIEQQFGADIDSVSVVELSDETFEVTIWMEGFNCPVTDNVELLPKLNVTITHEIVEDGYDLIAGGAQEYVWILPDGTTFDHQTLEIGFPFTPEIYSVIGEAPGYCSDTATLSFVVELDPGYPDGDDSDSVSVGIGDPNGPGGINDPNNLQDGNYIIVPNLFTPNGDNTNDRYYLTGEGVTSISFKIYTTDGILVYETNSVTEIMSRDEGWDGRINGNPAPAGVYLWYLSGTYGDDIKISHEGNKGILNLMY